MLTPAYLQEIPKSVIAIYSELENEIITDIARRIAKANYITPAAEWQIYRAQELSKSYNQVVKEVAQLTAKTDKEVEKLFRDSAITALEYDDAIYNEAFKQGLAANKPLPLVRSPQMVALLQAGIKQTKGLLKNFTQTTAINAQRQLGEALDLAHMQITSGAFAPQQAIRNAVKTIADAGIKAFNYKSGHSDQVDVAVRRAVITGINQTTSKLQLTRADEMGCDLVEVSSHFGARPSHAAWQGGIYSRSGKHNKYADFVSSTGYGSGDGLCGWNCYHNFYPYYEGLSSQSFTRYDKEANDKAYEQSQMQRKYERAVRSEKHKCVAYDAAGDKEMFNKHAVKLKNREQQLKDFLEETGRYRDTDRESVGGFGRSVSGSAVWADKRNTHERYKGYLGTSKINDTLDKLSDIEYNGDRWLLDGFVKAVDKGDISVLVGFNTYASTAREIEKELIGLTTKNGITIEGYVPHFVDRVIGQVSVTHKGKRTGVPVRHIKDTLLNAGEVEEVIIKSNGKPSQSFLGRECDVAINPADKLLIQTNPN